MVFFEWKDEYELDLPHIDLQHTMIVNMLNELHASVREGPSRKVTGKILDQLQDYVESHFSVEEELMEEFRYPDTPAHRKEHEALRLDVHDMKQNWLAGRDIVAYELLDYLKNWLADHICRIDRAFGEYVHAANRSPSDPQRP